LLPNQGFQGHPTPIASFRWIFMGNAHFPALPRDKKSLDFFSFYQTEFYFENRALKLFEEKSAAEDLVNKDKRF